MSIFSRPPITENEALKALNLDLKDLVLIRDIRAADSLSDFIAKRLGISKSTLMFVYDNTEKINELEKAPEKLISEEIGKDAFSFVHECLSKRLQKKRPLLHYTVKDDAERIIDLAKKLKITRSRDDQKGLIKAITKFNFFAWKKLNS